MIFNENTPNFIDFKESFKELPLSDETFKIIEENGIKLREIAIGEFSGRDSVAAIIKAIEEGIDFVLPVVAFTGTDYGNINIFTKTGRLSIKESKKLIRIKFYCHCILCLSQNSGMH